MSTKIAEADITEEEKQKLMKKIKVLAQSKGKL